MCLTSYWNGPSTFHQPVGKYRVLLPSLDVRSIRACVNDCNWTCLWVLLAIIRVELGGLNLLALRIITVTAKVWRACLYIIWNSEQFGRKAWRHVKCFIHNNKSKFVSFEVFVPSANMRFKWSKLGKICNAIWLYYTTTVRGKYILRLCHSLLSEIVLVNDNWLSIFPPKCVGEILHFLLLGSLIFRVMIFLLIKNPYSVSNLNNYVQPDTVLYIYEHCEKGLYLKFDQCKDIRSCFHFLYPVCVWVGAGVDGRTGALLTSVLEWNRHGKEDLAHFLI